MPEIFIYRYQSITLLIANFIDPHGLYQPDSTRKMAQKNHINQFVKLNNCQDYYPMMRIRKP